MGIVTIVWGDWGLDGHVRAGEALPEDQRARMVPTEIAQRHAPAENLPMPQPNYGYLSEKLGAAVRTMLVPESNARALAGAMHEILLGCRKLRIEEDEQAERWRRKLLDVIESAEGSWEELAESMTADERHTFATTTWELRAWAHRAFWSSDS